MGGGGDDWQPKRDDVGEAKWKKYLDDRKGKNRFDFVLEVDEYVPDFSDVEAARHYGGQWLWSFGLRRGHELENWDGWIKGSVESMVAAIRKEKTPRPITMVWEEDSRPHFFNSFKGKKLDYLIEIDVATAGSVAHTKFLLTLKDCRITEIYYEFQMVDKKRTKFQRINSICRGDIELKNRP